MFYLYRSYSIGVSSGLCLRFQDTVCLVSRNSRRYLLLLSPQTMALHESSFMTLGLPKEKGALRQQVFSLYQLARYAAANEDRAVAIPLILGTGNAYKPYAQARGFIDQHVAEVLELLLTPSIPGDRSQSRYQVGLDRAHIKQMIADVNLASTNSESDNLTLTKPTVYSQQIAVSHDGVAIRLMAGMTREGVRMAFVTSPGILPAISGA